MATSARLEELKTRFDENPRRYFAPLANEHRKMGDLARAIEICRAHLPAQPGHVSGHIVLAQALHESGQVDEAQQEFEAALELDPENLIALRFMGDIARGRGDVDSARAWYERVLDADPRNDEVSGYLRDLNETPPQSASLAPPAITTRGPRLTPMMIPPVDESTDTASTGTPSSTTEVRSVDQPQDSYLSAGTFATPHEATAPAEAHDAAADEPAGVSSADQEDRAALRGQGFFSTGADQFGAPAEGTGRESEDEERPSEPAQADLTAPGTDTLAQAGDTGSLEIDPFDIVSSGPEATDEPDVAREWQPTGQEARHEAAEEIDFETVWSPGATSGEAVTETPDSSHSVPESSGESPDDEAEYDAYWKSHTPASVEYSDLAAVPEDWFTDDPSATVDPSTAHEAPVEAGDVGSTRSDEIASWFDEAATTEDRNAAESVAPDLPENERESPDADASGANETWSAYDAWGTEQDPTIVPPEGEPAQEIAPAAANVEPEEPIGSDTEREPAGKEPAASEPVADWDSSTTLQAHGVDEEKPESQTSLQEPGARPTMDVPQEPEADPFATEEPASAPFVTETLAELYLQQGFREEAIAIYRRLVDRNPLDQRLHEKLDDLEASHAEAINAGATDAQATYTEAGAAESETERGAEEAAGPLAGISVREFFSSLARREPFTRGPSGGGPGTSAGYAGAARRAPDSTGEPSSEVPVDFAPHQKASSGEYPESNSALAQMFGAASPSTTDAAAATTLASAFDVGHGAPPPQGRPSRVSDRELSLDHLFREPESEQGGAVSMDEFYSSGAKPDAADSPDEGSKADERDPDITQFSAWLEGLKKK